MSDSAVADDVYVQIDLGDDLEIASIEIEADCDLANSELIIANTNRNIVFKKIFT